MRWRTWPSRVKTESTEHARWSRSRQFLASFGQGESFRVFEKGKVAAIFCEPLPPPPARPPVTARRNASGFCRIPAQCQCLGSLQSKTFTLPFEMFTIYGFNIRASLRILCSHWVESVEDSVFHVTTWKMVIFPLFFTYFLTFLDNALKWIYEFIPLRLKRKTSDNNNRPTQKHKCMCWYAI